MDSENDGFVENVNQDMMTARIIGIVKDMIRDIINMRAKLMIAMSQEILAMKIIAADRRDQRYDNHEERRNNDRQQSKHDNRDNHRNHDNYYGRDTRPTSRVVAEMVLGIIGSIFGIIGGIIALVVGTISSGLGETDSGSIFGQAIGVILVCIVTLIISCIINKTELLWVYY